jgi:hypothetical protein
MNHSYSASGFSLSSIHRNANLALADHGTAESHKDDFRRVSRSVIVISGLRLAQYCMLAGDRALHGQVGAHTPVAVNASLKQTGTYPAFSAPPFPLLLVLAIA